MTEAFKEQAIKTQGILKKDLTVLDSTHKAAESNIAKLQNDNRRLHEHNDTSWGTTWLNFGALLTVAVIFVVTFFFMRLVPKPPR